MKLSPKDMALIALFAAVITVCSWISVPAAVPFTLQTFAVFTAALLLGGRRGLWAVVLYIFLGAVGLPVFSGFRGGFGALLGPTGGYILGFILSVLVIWAVTARAGNSPWVQLLGMVLALAVCYAFGTAWFMVVYTPGKGAHRPGHGAGPVRAALCHPRSGEDLPGAAAVPAAAQSAVYPAIDRVNRGGVPYWSSKAARTFSAWRMPSTAAERMPPA